MSPLLGRLTLLFLRTGRNTGALTKVRPLRDFDPSIPIHEYSVGNGGVNAMVGDKWVDPGMYPGLCVRYCILKGVSASHKAKI